MNRPGSVMRWRLGGLAFWLLWSPAILAGPWEEVRKINASDGGSADNFGTSVVFDGDTLAVGAPVASAVYIFERNRGGEDQWGEVAKLVASDAGTFDLFGFSIDLSGDTVVVGAFHNDDACPADPSCNSGAAYIFERNQGGADNWGEVTKLTPSDAMAGDTSGLSVAIDGDLVVVGAPGNDEVGADAGAAYLFERNQGGAGNWGEVTQLTASDAAAFDGFGSSASIDSPRLVIGAVGNDDAGESSGAVYIFERDEGGTNNWGEVTKRIASDGVEEENFGRSVALDGDTLVVGASGDAFNSVSNGSAYVFERSEGGKNNWGEVTQLTASDGGAGDEFGRSLAISGHTILVGARFDDDLGTGSGSAYLFELDPEGSGEWSEVARLAALDGVEGDEFGFSVAISGPTLFVGSRFDDDLQSASGSVYLFEKTQIFADGFESGDSSVWSSVSP